MKRTIIFRRKILLLLLVLVCHTAIAQVVIKGTVYDKQARYGVPHVSVLTSSGVGTVTDTLGRYSIKVPNDDSIYFSYLGKMSSKFPVKRLPVDQPLDISLPVSVDSLPSVTVRQPSYRMDSIANRKEYQKVFDYDPVIGSAPGSGFGLGIGLDAIFNARKFRRMEALKARLLRGHGIRSRLEVAHFVGSIFSGGGLFGDVGAGVGDDDRRVRDPGPTGVEYAPANHAECSLRRGNAAEQKKKRKNAHGSSMNF